MEEYDPVKSNSLRNKMIQPPLLIEGVQFEKPEDIKLAYTINTMRPVKLELRYQCMQCEEKIQTTY
jgi:hypothetical protein